MKTTLLQRIVLALGVILVVVLLVLATNLLPLSRDTARGTSLNDSPFAEATPLWLPYLVRQPSQQSTQTPTQQPTQAPTQQPTQQPPPPPAKQNRRVNIPFFSAEVPMGETAIFWFGLVNRLDNYTDVRMGYNQDGIAIHLAIIDRTLWYDPSATAEELTDWDSVSLYFSLQENPASNLEESDFRFDAQLNWSEPRQAYQAAYRGNSSGWQPALLPFTTTTGWRGNAPNDNATLDNGWWIDYIIPFTAFGLAGPPPPGTMWRLGVVTHDRDVNTAPLNPDKVWPETFRPDQPDQWGELHFGLPQYQRPPSEQPFETLLIRQGLNGQQVMDAMVGGSTDCGDLAAGDNDDYYRLWGYYNYFGASQVNIQNQLDIADWGCFSKVYITFPLEQLPNNREVISATLELRLFGNSNPEKAKPSLIQVLSVKEDWDEAKINWNNAPLAFENISQAWVNPTADGYAEPPSDPYRWDVSLAAAEAYKLGEPLRLVLYSSDLPRHTGKYFWSSDVDEFLANVRPLLSVLLGMPSGQ